MNQCKILHETIVRDILDVIDDVKDFDQVEWVNKKGSVGSISRRASNLILVFPVICSTSLSVATAATITKAIERKCVSLLQILFSSIQLTSAKDMNEYIKLFHTNLNSKLTLDDFMSAMDKLVDENAITITDADAYQMVKEDMQNINYYLNDYINPVSINDYKIKNNIYGESTIMCEAKDDDRYENFTKKMDKELDNFMDAARKAVKNINRMNNNNISDIALKDRTEYFKNQLSVNDVQKVNELVPTTMIVNFATNDGSLTKYITTGIIGVKAKLYPVDSMDIITRVSSKVKESNGLFNLVRASTREISFFKDLAFAIDKAKMDAINMAKNSNNAKMFKLLERRAAKNRFSALLKKNDASPITSLIISQDEVEYLKKYHTIDMEKPYVTRSILEKYNLMDIVIADEALEIARFLFDDGDGIFETLPFDALEKEAKDSSYKKVVNLMSKLNR